MRLAMLACVAAAFTWAGGPVEAAVAERSCHIEEFETPVRCVTIDAPRDYDRPEDGAVKVTAVIIPASTGRPSPDPVVLLAGGPGQSASSLPGLLPALISEARKTRDVVLFDLRGMGLSEPLHCPNMQSTSFFGDASTLAAAGALAQMDTFAKDCLALHGEKARNHTSREAVEDIERFRQAMGYPKLNLWGGSFGTRIAQHYVRAYGQHTRSVVLDAVAPVGLSVLASGAKTPDKALETIIAACEKDAACARRFPAFRADVAAILARADAGPVTGSAPDPISGVRGRFTLDRLSIGNAIRVALYSKTTTELLPFAVTEAAKDNWAPILGMMSAALDEKLSMGAQFSMLCAEDWSQANGLNPADRTGALMKDGYFRIFSPACAIWPMDPLPPDMLAAFKSDALALAISGAYDPVTPPELGEQALAQFSNGRHLVVPNGFHTNSASPCIARIIGRFLENPAAQPDEACVARMPSLHFFLGAAG
jgi:pimeloyl-ACP methyl ester carboxylesterase